MRKKEIFLFCVIFIFHISAFELPEITKVLRDPADLLIDAYFGINNYGYQYDVHSLKNHSSPVRFKRSTNSVFDEFHSKMTLTARVFAGISIRLGLHNNSIPGDELVAELMNLDSSVKMEDVEKFDKQTVDGFVASLVGLVLQTSAELNKLELMITSMNTWREDYESISNWKNVDSLNKYIDKAKEFNSSQISYTATGGLETSLQTAIDTSTNLETENLRNIEILKEKLKEFEGIPKKFTDFKKTLDTFEDLTTDITRESEVLQMVTLIREFFLTKYVVQDLRTSSHVELKSAFTGVNGLFASSPSPKKDLVTMVQTVLSQNSPRITQTHTWGFSNGISDMKNLPRDAQDSWLKTAIPVGYDVNLIVNEVRQLETLRIKSETLASKWTGLKDEQKLNHVRSIAELVSLYETTQASPVDFDNMMSKIPGLDQLPRGNSNFNEHMEKLVDNIEKLRQEMSFMIGKLKQLTEMESFKKFEDLMKFGDFIVTENNGVKRTLTEVVSQMKTFGRIDEVIAVLTEMKPLFKEIEEILKKVSTLTIDAGDIDNSRSNINTFVKDADTIEVVKYFDKLKGSAANLKPMAQMVNLVRHARVMKEDATLSTNIPSIADTIHNSISSVRDVRSAPETVRTTVTPGIDTLVQLKDFNIVSKPFRESATLTDDIQKVFDAIEDVKEVMSEGWSVDGKIDSLKNHDKEKYEIMEDWGSFGELFTEMHIMLEHLKNQKKQFTQLAATLSGNGGEFGKLRNLKEVKKERLERRLKAVEKLAKLNADTKLDIFVQSLRKLTNLDLHFATYAQALQGVDQSIITVVGRFAGMAVRSVTNSPMFSTVTQPVRDSIGDLLTSTIAGIVDPMGTFDGKHASNSADGKEEDSAEAWKIFGISAGGSCLFFLVVIAGLIIAYWKCYAPKRILAKLEAEKNELARMKRELDKARNTIAEMERRIHSLQEENEEKREIIKDMAERRLDGLDEKDDEEKEKLQKQLDELKKDQKKTKKDALEMHEKLLQQKKEKAQADIEYEEMRMTLHYKVWHHEDHYKKRLKENFGYFANCKEAVMKNCVEGGKVRVVQKQRELRYKLEKQYPWNTASFVMSVLLDYLPLNSKLRSQYKKFPERLKEFAIIKERVDRKIALMEKNGELPKLVNPQERRGKAGGETKPNPEGGPKEAKTTKFEFNVLNGLLTTDGKKNTIGVITTAPDDERSVNEMLTKVFELKVSHIVTVNEEQKIEHQLYYSRDPNNPKKTFGDIETTTEILKTRCLNKDGLGIEKFRVTIKQGTRVKCVCHYNLTKYSNSIKTMVDRRIDIESIIVWTRRFVSSTAMFYDPPGISHTFIFPVVELILENLHSKFLTGLPGSVESCILGLRKVRRQYELRECDYFFIRGMVVTLLKNDNRWPEEVGQIELDIYMSCIARCEDEEYNNFLRSEFDLDKAKNILPPMNRTKGKKAENKKTELEKLMKMEEGRPRKTIASTAKVVLEDDDEELQVDVTQEDEDEFIKTAKEEDVENMKKMSKMRHAAVTMDEDDPL